MDTTLRNCELKQFHFQPKWVIKSHYNPKGGITETSTLIDTPWPGVTTLEVTSLAIPACLDSTRTDWNLYCETTTISATTGIAKQVPPHLLTESPKSDSEDIWRLCLFCFFFFGAKSDSSDVTTDSNLSFFLLLFSFRSLCFFSSIELSESDEKSVSIAAFLCFVACFFLKKANISLSMRTFFKKFNPRFSEMLLKYPSMYYIRTYIQTYTYTHTFNYLSTETFRVKFVLRKYRATIYEKCRLAE